jgi:hypothetical protein
MVPDAAYIKDNADDDHGTKDLEDGALTTVVAELIAASAASQYESARDDGC